MKKFKNRIIFAWVMLFVDAILWIAFEFFTDLSNNFTNIFAIIAIVIIGFILINIQRERMKKEE